MPEERKKILEVKHLKQYFKNGRTVTKGVDDVSFDIYEGEVFGLVGESGSGKTTTGRSILQLYKPTAGEVLFEGKDVAKLHGRDEQLAFRRDAQMIFQDPYASLNPRMTVEDIIAEGLDIHHLVKDKAERRKRVEELLETVGLNRNHAPVSHTNSPVVSGKESGSPGLWPLNRSSSWPTNLFQPWTCPFKPRLST